MINFSQLEQIADGKVVQLHADLPVEYLLTDSRKIIINPHAVFFAIRGERHDGRKFIPELFDKGVRQFVTDGDIDLEEEKKAQCNIFRASDTLSALQKVAALHRNQFDIPVIGITGSNGKTIVKEWLNEILSENLKIVRSPKSYNSQLGAPLSVWQMNASHELGIFEAGISRPGEMEKLQAVIQPTIGIFTNIGAAHDEGFASRVQKAEEKVRLFKSCRVVVYCKDYPEIQSALSGLPDRQTVLFSWSGKTDADIVLKNVTREGSFSRITLLFEGKALHFDAPFTDRASIENCMHCIAYLLYENFAHAFIQKQLNRLSHVTMRLELKHGVNDSYIIDDSYSADLASLQIALDFLDQQNQRDRKTVVLSDILQSGIAPKALYKHVAELLKSRKIDRLIGIGPDISAHKDVFRIASEFYPSTEAFLKEARKSNFDRELILVKGARVFGFEKIVRKLEHKIHGTALEINLDALVNNLNYYKSKLKPGVKLMTMVKAFAYGSGINEIAHLMQYHRVDYLAVAYADEGAALRENGIDLPIMVMNPSPDSFNKIVEYNLEPEIYSLGLMKAALNFLELHDKKINIHLKLDTGMRRLGFVADDFDELIRLLKANEQVRIVSVFSHMAGTDEGLHDDFTQQQVEKFMELVPRLERELGIQPLKHVLNSAGILRFPQYQFDMVRLGVGLYGVGADPESQRHLMPISELKTRISQIKRLEPGDTVGYGRVGKARGRTTIATIGIGYADGFSRAFSNGAGVVLVNGKQAPVIGNVCMDMTMVDISGIEAEEGDEVVIFGKDLSIDELARRANTIPYEILTSVSDRVKRVFFSE